MKRALFHALLTCALFSALPASTQSSLEDARQWESSPLGDTLIVRLPSAPFPHESRVKGYRYRDQHYPADTHYADNSMAIFVPAGFDPSGPTDLLIYFHGWNNHIAKALEDFRLREMLVASGCNAVLVFPQGPRDAPDSSGGRLEEPGAFKALCDDVLRVLVEEERVPEPVLGRVSLSGHSGAFGVIAKALQHGGIDSHIRRVYLLDASYGYLDTFANWIADDAPARADRRLYSIFTEHLADEIVGIMTRLGEGGVSYALTIDTFAEQHPGVLGRDRATFLHTTTLTHDQTVAWLERWLKADQAAGSTHTLEP